MMTIRKLVFALALLAPIAAQAAEPAPAPKEECCCCKKGEDGKMECCAKMKAAGTDKDAHAGHAMPGMEAK